MKKVLCAAVTLWGAMSSSAAFAQTPGPWGSWVIGTLQLPSSLENRWGGFVEGQARADKVFRQFFYNELKGGVSYDLDKNFTVLLGAGRYSTFDDPGPVSVEKRLWQQLVLNQFMSRLKIEHRYRVEQRWFTFPTDGNDSSVFRQRLRYRLNAFVPLHNKTITDKTFFLSVYDEIFLNPRGPVLERNRVFAGLGYQYNSHLNVQVGWLRQANYSQPTLRQGQFVGLGTSTKNNLVFTVIYRLARRNTTARPESMPSQQD